MIDHHDDELLLELDRFEKGKWSVSRSGANWVIYLKGQPIDLLYRTPIEYEHLDQALERMVFLSDLSKPVESQHDD